MSQNQPQPQPQQVVVTSSSRSDKEETFGELRGEIRRLQENLFSQLEDTIEKKQKLLEKENQKRLDQFQKEFEKFTDSCKYQQDNLYSALSKSISKYSEEGSNGSGNSPDDFMKFSSHLQNLIQQNNQLLMSSFDRKMNDLSASAKQTTQVDNSAELNEMRRKLDDIMRNVNKKPEPIVETVVRKVVKKEPPKEEIVTVVKAKPKEPPKPEPKPEPKVDPPRPKTPVVVKPKPEPEPVVERPKTPVMARPKPVEKPVQRVETPPRVKTPPPPKPQTPEQESFISETTTDSSDYSSTDTSMTSDNSNLGLRERIYKELKLGKIFDELDESIAYQHYEDKPWLKAKYKQNPKFVKVQNSETDQVFDHEMRTLGVDPSQSGITENEYLRGLQVLQKSRGNTVNNNPDHLVIMNALREQVDKIALDRLNGDSQQGNRVSFSHDPTLNDFINKLQKINDYDAIRRVNPTENQQESPRRRKSNAESPRRRISNAESPRRKFSNADEDPANDIPKVKIPEKPEPKMKAITIALEAQAKKMEMDAKKTVKNPEDNQPRVETKKPSEQMNTLKSTMNDTKQSNTLQSTLKSDRSLNNTKIIEAEFDDVTADEHDEGSTMYEVVGAQGGNGGGGGEESEYSTEYETETEDIEPPRQVAQSVSKPTNQVVEEEDNDHDDDYEEIEEEEEEVPKPSSQNLIQTFVAPESDEEIPPKQNVNTKSESNVKKQMELESESEEEHAVVRVVSKVSKVKIESSDDSDEELSRGGNLSNQALGNKFKSLNNMWDGMNNKKRPSKLDNINRNNDSSIDLPGSDDFDISAFKQNLTPNSRPGTAYSSDISGFIKTLKHDDDDLDTEEL
ncbi:hypothetical protein NAEGRDRAFT_79385 [Naegleria gruberi]|uniref:Cilium assembly protein DZIP1 domain-containing protein n=1 Tax=Naegleria gruberi TaxID=5762 RepID=D2VC25_NAEGR|nr:uncharacterized protein NAEGRDRAFT_79385 [Naegleria gruberi]EFC45584.1 hypothetical protein NAEGRDRAFT_79385 [Naegleria gruberi]|eukprot:XP_002678328.1 hypothetical protein NAEGRDRAFT_79385 [Naegleria gruberi strain NEG-M]